MTPITPESELSAQFQKLPSEIIEEIHVYWMARFDYDCLLSALIDDTEREKDTDNVRVRLKAIREKLNNGEILDGRHLKDVNSLIAQHPYIFREIKNLHAKLSDREHMGLVVSITQRCPKLKQPTGMLEVWIEYELLSYFEMAPYSGILESARRLSIVYGRHGPAKIKSGKLTPILQKFPGLDVMLNGYYYLDDYSDGFYTEAAEVFKRSTGLVNLVVDPNDTGALDQFDQLCKEKTNPFSLHLMFVRNFNMLNLWHIYILSAVENITYRGVLTDDTVDGLDRISKEYNISLELFVGGGFLCLARSTHVTKRLKRLHIYDETLESNDQVSVLYRIEKECPGLTYFAAVRSLNLLSSGTPPSMKVTDNYVNVLCESREA